jgi:hypothetical protein
LTSKALEALNEAVDDEAVDDEVPTEEPIKRKRGRLVEVRSTYVCVSVSA